MIRLVQVFSIGCIFGSLVIMQAVESKLGIAWHSSAYYAIRWAYIVPLICATIFMLRADFRWQKSVGMVKNKDGFERRSD
jgi:hypothetical protein